MSVLLSIYFLGLGGRIGTDVLSWDRMKSCMDELQVGSEETKIGESQRNYDTYRSKAKIPSFILNDVLCQIHKP